MSLVSERPKSGPPHYHSGHYKHSKPSLPKIALESAMRDFQAMFPTLTPMVIEAVLRANGGAVDPTVEKLISMCCDQQQQQQRRTQKKKEFVEDSDLLPGYYEACCKEQPPPSYHATQSYSDASTQTDVSKTEPDSMERLSIPPPLSGSRGSTSNVNVSQLEKQALYVQNQELIHQLRRKQRVIEYLERTCSREQSNGTKPNRYSDPVLSLVPCVEGHNHTLHSTRSRRTQTLSIQRQQNTSPPPNATVDTKETLDIPDHSMLPGLSRNQPSRKSAKKRLQSWSKKLLRRNAGSDSPLVSPASSQAHLLQQDGDFIDASSVSHC